MGGKCAFFVPTLLLGQIWRKAVVFGGCLERSGSLFLCCERKNLSPAEHYDGCGKGNDASKGKVFVFYPLIASLMFF